MEEGGVEIVIMEFNKLRLHRQQLAKPVCARSIVSTESFFPCLFQLKFRPKFQEKRINASIFTDFNYNFNY